MSAPGPAGERQEHMDATVAFAGAGQRRRLFRGLDILTMKWATGELAGGTSLLAQYAVDSVTTNGPARWRKRKKPRPTS